jgi:hypothetical protein
MEILSKIPLTSVLETVFLLFFATKEAGHVIFSPFSQPQKAS